MSFPVRLFQRVAGKIVDAVENQDAPVLKRKRGEEAVDLPRALGAQRRLGFLAMVIGEMRGDLAQRLVGGEIGGHRVDDRMADAQETSTDVVWHESGEWTDIRYATTDDGMIMGMRHRTLPIWGVQFHPEAYLTQHGLQMIKNWMK